MFAWIKQLINKIEPEFPSWADEIARPRLDMDVKVAAFTVIQKFYNTESTSCDKT